MECCSRLWPIVLTGSFFPSFMLEGVHLFQKLVFLSTECTVNILSPFLTISHSVVLVKSFFFPFFLCNVISYKH